ncbi:MAG: hypothetical protein IJU78_04370 [Clostridia bacterium]|nr:hypothetical protein [Clostridia bacterium]
MAQFQNQATLSYKGGSASSNIVTGELLEVLSMTKTAISTGYSRGSSITYVLSLLNSGTADISGLTVTDDLGEYDVGGATLRPLHYTEDSVRYYINGELQPAPTAEEAPEGTEPALSFGEISVPAGGNAMLIYETTANAFAPLTCGSCITNTATASSAALEATASATVPVAEEPELSISKSLSPQVLSENEELTYTFIIQNCGNAEADASAEIVVTDDFSPILSDISVSYNGAPLAEGTDYTYDAVNGAFATVSGVLTVPAASYARSTGGWQAVPGTGTLTVTGTI